jgi:hypothetical protein
VFGNILFPMTGYIEMALECGKTLLQEGILLNNIPLLSPLIICGNCADNLSVIDFSIYEPLALRSGLTHTLQLVATCSQEDYNEFSFEISSRLGVNPEVNIISVTHAHIVTEIRVGRI